MGQARSCIQGTPDWLGPYEKSSHKSPTDRELYDRLGELILLSTITKDYTALEEFLSNKSSQTKDVKQLPIQSKKSSTLASSSSTSSKSSGSSSGAAMRLEDIIRKETNYKSVNFSNEPETKSANMKPVIQKKQCTVHGGHHHHHTQPATPQRQHYSDCPMAQRNANSKQSAPVKTKRIPLSDLANQPARYSERRANQNEEASTDFQEKLNAAMPRQQPKVERHTDLLQESDFLTVDFKELIPVDTKKQGPTDVLASLTIQSAKEIIQRLEDRAESIVETFGVVLKHMEHGDWSTFCISTSRLCDDIRKIIRNNIPSETSDPEVIKIKNHVTAALNQLTGQILQYNLVNGEKSPNLLPSFRILGEVLHELMEFLISKELTVIVQNLQNRTSSYCVRIALCAIAEMAMSGSLMSRLIAKAGAVKPLIYISGQNSCQKLRMMALRTLTLLCANPDAVAQFEIASGLNVMAKIVSSDAEEVIKSEAVAVLAHITKQWSENSIVKQRMTKHIEQIVTILIDVAQKTPSSDAFLMSAASLSTLSNCNFQAKQWMKTHEREVRLLNSSSKHESYV